MKKTAAYLKNKKASGQKITMLTCYDYPTALVQEAAGVNVIFVGDSVGTNMLGYASEREVTLEDMMHHLKAVRRGVREAYLLVDLPYRTYETPEMALESARRLLSLGADGVKLEGFREAVIRHLSQQGIEVCAHLGLNPQLHEQKALHAKTARAAIELIENSLRLEAAGAVFLVLEMIPEEVGRIVTQQLGIPTIGIGTGRHTNGQVLIIHDLLGINIFDLRHAAKYEDLYTRSFEAVRRYVSDVTSGSFPQEMNVRHLKGKELAALEDWAADEGRWTIAE